MARPGQKQGGYNADPSVVRARGSLGAALRDGNEDRAAQAARELVKAKREASIREHRKALVAAGYRVEPPEDVAS
jgi:hypothetical protein